MSSRRPVIKTQTAPSITKRLNKITHIPENFLREDPPLPKSVKIELSSHCNYKCVNCSLYARNGKLVHDMDFGLFKRITGEMKSFGIEEIGPFFVGEPFMNAPRLVEAIRWLKGDLGISYVFVTTNGSLATPYRVKECMKAGLDSLKWSCNYSDKRQFTEMTGVKAIVFEFTLDHIATAKWIRDEGDYKTRLYASSIRYDHDQPLRMKELLDNNILPNVDEHYWLPLYSFGGNAVARENEKGFKPIAGNIGPLGDPAKPIPCWSLFTAGHVMSDGRMTGCCFDGLGQWVVGDLKKQTFKECWHSEEFRKLRRAHLSGDISQTPCKSCLLVN